MSSRLEQMKMDFLVAQQRRRDRPPPAADRPVDTDHDPLIADERADAPAAIAVGTLEPGN